MEALNWSKSFPQDTNIVGGETIFKQVLATTTLGADEEAMENGASNFLPPPDKIILSRINQSFPEADSFFPSIPNKANNQSKIENIDNSCASLNYFVLEKLSTTASSLLNIGLKTA